MQHYLSVDVGGTNMTVGLFEVHAAYSKPVFSLVEQRAYKSKEQNGIVPALADSLHYFGNKYSLPKNPPITISACGPTDGLVCQPTNLPKPTWLIDKHVLEKQFSTQICLINDFAAIAYSLMTIDAHEDAKIQHISPSPQASFSTEHTNIKVALGAGTGLGCATLHSYQDNTSLISSEAGWLNFAPDANNACEVLYLLFISSLSKDTFVQHNSRHSNREPMYSWEDAICASRGLNNIYHFFCNKEYSNTLLDESERTFLLENFSNVDDAHRPSQISVAALENVAPCKKILHFWIRLYARYAQQIALVTLPYGGVFIGGGAAAKNISLFLEEQLFYQTFIRHTNPQVQELVARMPLYIITEYSISLYGNAYHLHQTIGGAR